jgi:predicted GNAT family N-acyltransferase
VPAAVSWSIRAADYVADRTAIETVRLTVFVREQHVPPEIELDARDASCRHLLAESVGRAIGTGRIDLEAGGKIGRVAVLAEYRRGGVGTALMQRFHAIAVECGLDAVWCNAQLAAVPFYRRLGYRIVGERFHEAGIEHVRMEKTIFSQDIIG